MRLCIVFLLFFAVASADNFIPDHACTTPTNMNFSDSDRSLFLIIEGRKELSGGIRYLAMFIKAIFNKYKEQQNVNRIIIVAFTPDGHITYSNGPVTDPKEMQKALKIIEANAWNATDVSCNANVFNVIHDTFKAFSTFVQGASVIVASSSLPSDDSIDLALYVGQGYTPQTPIIDIIHLESKDCPVSAWTNNHTNLQYTIRSTNGVLVRSDPLDLPGIIQHFADFRKKPIRLAEPKFSDCTIFTPFKIQVDESLQEFNVFLSGNDSKVQVIDPSNTIFRPNFTQQYIYQQLWKYVPHMIGTYTITLHSQEKLCFPAIFGQGNSYVYFGFTQDPSNDLGSVFAARNSPNYPVFQFAMGPGFNSTLVKSSVSALVQGSQVALSNNTRVVRRKSCAFSYITDEFECGLEDQVISVVVNGVDSQNNPFTRFFTSFCKVMSTITTTMPTTTAPTTTRIGTLSTMASTPSSSPPSTTTTRSSTVSTVTSAPSSTPHSTSANLTSAMSTKIPIVTTTNLSSYISSVVSIMCVAFAMACSIYG